MKAPNTINSTVNWYFAAHIFALAPVSYGSLFWVDASSQASNYSHSRSFVFSVIWSPASLSGAGLHPRRAAGPLCRLSRAFGRTSACFIFGLCSTSAASSNSVTFLPSRSFWAVWPSCPYGDSLGSSGGSCRRIAPSRLSIGYPVSTDKMSRSGRCWNPRATFRESFWNSDGPQILGYDFDELVGIGSSGLGFGTQSWGWSRRLAGDGPAIRCCGMTPFGCEGS